MKLFEDFVGSPSLGCGERDLPLPMGSQRLRRFVGQVVLGLAPSVLKQRLQPLVKAAAKTVALQVRLRKNGPAIAQGIGWLSVAFGLVALVAPHAVSRVTGTRPAPGWIRVCGVRDLVFGAGLLTADDTRPWLKTRAAFDALDVVSIARNIDSGVGRHGTALLAMTGAAALAFVEASVATRFKIEAMQRESGRFDYSDRVGLSRVASAGPS